MDHLMSAAEYYEHGLTLKRVNMFLQAIEDFCKAAGDPQYAAKSQLQIALCLRDAGRYDDAIMVFRQVAESQTLSPEERRHILYHMGQAMEAAGRPDESLEVYEWIRREDPQFRDIAQRMKRLRNGECGSMSQAQGGFQPWIDAVVTTGQQLKPHVTSFLDQAGQWLSTQAENIIRQRKPSHNGSRRSEAITPRTTQPAGLNRSASSAMPVRRGESRRHPRVPMRLRVTSRRRGV